MTLLLAARLVAEFARVHPIGGWWRENPGHARYDQQVRYCLVVSIRAVNGDIDIYTPVQTKIGLAVAVR